jgi:uncharacterized RDD family membrane protein YckC
MAALVDSLLIVVVQFVVLGVMWGVVALTIGDPMGTALGPWIIAILGLIAFSLLWGYYVLFEMIWNGQSPGKRWVGLRVIKSTGAPISLVDSIIRNLVRLVDFMPAYYGVGVIVMFFNDQARRLGDFAAGTLVVREQKDVTLESLSAAPRRPSQAPQKEPLPGLQNLTTDDYDLIARYLQRRYNLANRGQLARKLASSIRARMGLPPEDLSHQAADEFLVQVADAYRQHARSGGQ